MKNVLKMEILWLRSRKALEKEWIICLLWKNWLTGAVGRINGNGYFAFLDIEKVADRGVMCKVLNQWGLSERR